MTYIMGYFLYARIIPTLYTIEPLFSGVMGVALFDDFVMTAQ
jgi:hypothetical protein